MKYLDPKIQFAYDNPIIRAEQAVDPRYYHPVLVNPDYTIWAGITINR